MRRVAPSLLILAALLAAACGRTTSAPVTQHYSRTPEEAVQRAFDSCQAGEYDEAVRLYINGPELLKTSPGMAKEMVDRACFTYKGTATWYRINQKQERGDGAEIRAEVFFYPKEHSEHKWEFNPWRITLLKQPRGWLIAEAV